MTFKNLEDRFTKTSQDIYNRFPSPPGQYVQVKPDTASAYSRIKDDSRELPIVSTKRDLERVAKFLKSGNGVLFIGKQLLLQTGNTFAETRLYNPASPLVNTVPFTHSTRYINQSNISGLSGILGTGTSTMPSRGFLQKDTVNLFTTSPAASNLISRYLDRLLSPVNSILGAFGAQSTARPESTVFDNPKIGPFIKIPQNRTERGSISKKASAPNKDSDVVESWQSSKDRYVRQSQTDFTGTRIFRRLEKSNGARGYLNQYPAIIDNETKTVLSPGRNISDPYNRTPFFPEAGFYDGLYSANTQTSPDVESGIKADIIKFMFTTMGANKTSNNVHFRAFLSSLNQTVTPQFNEQQYIGRTERFVTYGGVKRTVSLKFHIAAFSQSEINTAWLRVNYLTGLAFPKGVINGFMVPPLFKITVGNIYDNQPCYINTLEFIMLDDSTTFDIDAEVSQVIEVTMQLTLLEKTTQLYDSPFYAITEALPVNEAANLKKMSNTPVPNININTPSYDTLANTRNNVGMNLSSYAKINNASLLGGFRDININTPSYGDLSTTLNNTTPKFAASKGKIVGDIHTVSTLRKANDKYVLGVPTEQIMRYRYGGDPTTLPPTLSNDASMQPVPMGVLIKATVDNNIQKVNDNIARSTERIIRADIRSKMTNNFSIPPIILYDENSNYRGPEGKSGGLEFINGTTNLFRTLAPYSTPPGMTP